MLTNNNFEKSKRILVVLTGGTICSKFSEKEENVKVCNAESGLILEQCFNNSYSPFANTVEFVLSDFYGIFSENMTVVKWNMLMNNLRSIPEIYHTALKHGNYPSISCDDICNIKEEKVCDGIIIAHGTDSLAYSSALFSILLKNIGVPVFLVSSNEALSADCANGTDNFISAVECICMGIKPNVYVTYKNISDRKMYLHYASRLLQCANYQADFFSAGMVDISDLSQSTAAQLFGKLPVEHLNMRLEDDLHNEFVIDLFGTWQLRDSVLLIDPYVGLNYNFFDFDRVEAILHGTYHSGTVCSEPNDTPKYEPGDNNSEYKNSILYLIEKVGNKKIYISPSDVFGNIYETTKNILANSKENVFFVNGFTKEMMYAKLLVAFSYEPLRGKINDFISAEYNHEIIIDYDGSSKLIYP